MLKSLLVRHKPLFKLFSVLLCISVLFTGGTLNAFAETQKPDYNNLIVEELEEKRTEYSKTYLRNDGQLETVVSAIPIHYKELGAWVEYDNTLTEDNKGNLKNKKSPLNINLPSENGNDKEVSLSKDDYSISLKLVGAKNSKANKKDKEENKTPRKDKTAQEMLNDSVVLTNSVTYTNALENTDVTYDINTNSLKESIVLKSQPKKAVSYTYQIRTENLAPVLNDNGSVSFYDEKDTTKLVFYIPAPFMFDSNDEYSYDIETNLEIKNKKATLTYTPSYEWLTYYNREYPVTIDPPVYAVCEKDAYTYSATAKQDAMLGFEDQLKVGKSCWLSSCDFFDTYIKFPTLPTLPEGAIITDVSIVLQVKQLCGTWNTLDIGAYQILEEWQNVLGGEYLTYVNRPECAENPAVITTLTNDVSDSVNIDVTPIAKDWYENPEFNFGVKLSMENETEDNWDSIIFHSKQSAGNVPFLSVIYIEPIAATGIEIVKPENNTLRRCETSAYYNFNCNVFPTNATNKEVIWSSSNESVATFDECGMLRELTTGTTVITATLKANPAISDSFTLTIEESPISELIIYGNSQLYINGSSQTHLYFTHNLDEDPELIYTSSNPSVVTVSSTGRISTYSNVGTATITVQAKDYPEAKHSMMISVDTLINNLPPNNTIAIGKTWQLSTIPNTVAGSYECKVFESTGSQGSIKAKTGGTELVYVNLLDYDGSVIASQECYLTASGSLTINCLPENNTIGHQDSLYLSVAENYVPEQLQWYSSDSSVASCYYSTTFGWKLQAHKPGTTILTAAHVDSISGIATVTGYATLTVANEPVESVELWTQGDRTIFYSGEIFSVNALIDSPTAYYDATYWVDDETYLTREPFAGVNYSCSNRIRYKAKEVEVPVTTTVEVTIGGMHDYIDLTIKPSGIAVENIPEDDIAVGDTYMLSYTAYGLAEFVEWKIYPENSSVISISGNKIIAKSPGTAYVCAKAINSNSGHTYYSECFAVTVIQLPTSISIVNKPANNTLYKGSTRNLSVMFTPSNTTCQDIIWDSKDKSVAKFIDGNTLSVVGYGKTKITATSTQNANVYDEFVLISPCGGANYKDVSQHNMILQDDAYYQCSVCDYRVKSPELQDYEILDREDYLYIVSAMIVENHCNAVLQENSRELDILQNQYFRDQARLVIDFVRSKSKYINKYQYSDGNGYYYHNSDLANLTVNYAQGVMNEQLLPLYNGQYDLVSDLVVGYYFKNFAIFEGALEFLKGKMDSLEFAAWVAGMYGFDELETGLSIAQLYIEQSNTSICIGDRLIVFDHLAATIQGSYGTITVIFDNNDNIKFIGFREGLVG